jgi:hypothetical protein
MSCKSGPVYSPSSCLAASGTAANKAASRNTDESEDLLATFERTQTIFEDDLAQITRERE